MHHLKIGHSVIFKSALLVLMLVSLYLLVQWHLQPIPARGLDVASNEFSAQRAFLLLSELLAEELPHPVQSQANQRLRQRIVTHLSTLGYEAEVQQAMGCSEWAGCAKVENITALLPGIEDGPAVMVVAHYDSVDEGPGVADDGAGVVAVLEVARILRDEAPFQKPILFLLTDGEERGLLGARAFVESHPQAQNVAVALNFEARGTSGVSGMFETSEGNGWLIQQYAQVVPRPTASSLFFEVYKRMPNDTDLTIFKGAGMAGYGFAFIDDVENYHTPNDNLQNLSLDSLQHHGENAVALTRHLANTDLTQVRSKNLIYHDILSLFVVHYPIWLGQLLAALLSVWFIGLAILLIKKGHLSTTGMMIGLCGIMVTLLMPFPLLLIPANFWDTVPFPRLWIVLLVTGITYGISWVPALRCRILDVSIAVWTLWLLISLLTLWLLPGASIIFFLPTLCAGILHGLLLWKRTTALLVILLSTICAGIIWFKLILLFDIALSILMGPAIIALPLALFASAALPLFMTSHSSHSTHP